MAHPYRLVTGATRQPLPYGLSSVVDFREDPDMHWIGGVEFDHLPCEPGGIQDVLLCEPDGTPAAALAERNFPGSGYGTASSFSVYGTFACSPVTIGFVEAQERATEHLWAFEQVLAEMAFESRLASLDVADKVTFTNSNPAWVMGLLEEHIAHTYGSLGVIHIPRAATYLLKDFLDIKGRTATTKLGTPVILGAGYGSGGQSLPTSTSGATSYTVYATPALFGYRSDVQLMGDRPGDLFKTGTNDLQAIAERFYLIGMDSCPIGVATISTQ